MARGVWGQNELDLNIKVILEAKCTGFGDEKLTQGAQCVGFRSTDV